MKRFIILIGMIACSLFIFSGCGMLPETSQFITQPTTAEAKDSSSLNLINKVGEYLPENASVYVPASPAGMSAISQVDINNDGKQEIFVTYKVKGTPDKVGAIILSEEDGKLKKVWEQEGPGYDIDYVAFKDITGDGNIEILIGWTIGASAGSDLTIFTTKNGEIKKVSGIAYNKLELLDIQTKQMSTPKTYLSIWQKDTGDTFFVDVVEWADESLIPASEVYHMYFPKVVEYYQTRVKEMPDAAFYWYYLADAQIKSGLFTEAQYSIDKGLTLNPEYYPSKEQFLELKELAIEMSKQERNFSYEHPYYPFALTFPNAWEGNITIEDSVKQEDEKLMSVFYNLENGENELLFSIFMYDEKMWKNESQANPERQLLGTKNDKAFVLVTREENENQPKEYASFLKEIPSIAKSFTFEKAYKVELHEEILLRNLLLRAKDIFWNVQNNGMYDKPFRKDGLDHIFLDEQLDTEQKLFGYLQTEFTIEAAKAYLQQSGLVEVDGKLAKVVADGGSILNWEKAKVVSMKEEGKHLIVLWSVPYGDSYDMDIVETIFKREADAWKLDSNPFQVF